MYIHTCVMYNPLCTYAPCKPGGRPGGKRANEASIKTSWYAWLKQAGAHESTQHGDTTLMNVSNHARVHGHSHSMIGRPCV